MEAIFVTLEKPAPTKESLFMSFTDIVIENTSNFSVSISIKVGNPIVDKNLNVLRTGSTSETDNADFFEGGCFYSVNFPRSCL